MEYGQIRLASDPNTPNELAVHRLRADGTTACGKTLKSWRGQQAVLAELTTAEEMAATLATSTGMCGCNGCRE